MDLEEMSEGDLSQQRGQAEERLKYELITERPSQAINWLTTRLPKIDQRLKQIEASR
jgi:hypothetical protein